MNSTKSRAMNRIRTLSQSSRQNAHEHYSRNIAITTDYDKKLASHEDITPFPDEDLIFYMSPIHSHHPVITSSPSFHTLYSFPRPLDTGTHDEQAHSDGSSQNAHFLEHPATPPATAQGLVGEQDLVAPLPRPFATSLLNANPSPRKGNYILPTPPNTPRPLHPINSSSPIPIPCTNSSRSEVGAVRWFTLSPESQRNGSPPYPSENKGPLHVEDSQSSRGRVGGPVRMIQTNFH